MSDRDPPEHWCLVHMGECVICGKDESFRERVYGKKPFDANERYAYPPDDACWEHFL